jgi:hypothetical protein
MATPTPIGGTPLYHIPEEEHGQKFDVPTQLEGLPELKPEDHQYFGKLLKEVGSFTPLVLGANGTCTRSHASVPLSCSIMWAGSVLGRTQRAEVECAGGG